MAEWGWWWDIALQLTRMAQRRAQQQMRRLAAHQRQGETLAAPGPTSIPQETGMNRRVSPCGLRGGTVCHQGASWPPLSGRMASVRRCQVSQRWTSGRLSQMRLHPVSQACGHVLRPASSVCIWLCLDHQSKDSAESAMKAKRAAVSAAQSHCDATSLDTCLVTTIHPCIALRPS